MFKARLILCFIAACLLLSFSVYWRTQLLEPDVEFIAKRIQKNIERKLIELDKDAGLILDSIQHKRDWPVTSNGFLLYDSSRALQWNVSHAIPDLRDFHGEIVQLVSNGGSVFLTKNYAVDSAGQHLIGLILLQERFPIKNQYLSDSFNPSIFPESEINLMQNGQGTPVVVLGVPVFHISSIPNAVKQYDVEWLGWLTLSLGMLFLFLAIRGWVMALKRRGLSWLAAILIFLALLIGRFIMVYGEYPGNVKTFSIFDAAHFASSTFSNSIGNFFLNTVAFVLAAGFTSHLVSTTSVRFWIKGSRPIKLVVITFFLILCFGFHLLPFLYLETIFHNSSITVDIAQQLFSDPVRLLAFGCVVLSTLTGFYFFYTFYRTAFSVTQRNPFDFWIPLTIATLSILIYHVYTERTYEIPILMTLFHLVILFYSSTNRRLKAITNKRFSLVLLALVIFSVQASLSIRLLSMERQQKAMTRFGNSFLIERDVLAEYLLDQAAETILSDPFIQRQFTNPFNRLGSISQKIKRSHLNNYFDRYQIQISLYDAKGLSMGGDSQATLDSLRQSLLQVETLGKSKSYFLGTNSSANSINRYVLVVPVQATVSGFIVVDLQLREVSPVSVFPRLLLDARYSHYASGFDYSHAIYNSGTLQNSSGSFKYAWSKFNFQLSNPKLFREGLVVNDYYHIALEDLSGRVAVVSTKAYSFFNLITNFSFLFLLGLVVGILGVLVSVLLNWRATALTYSGRIQAYVYAALLLPLLAIGITTLRLNAISEQNHSEAENMQKADRLAQNLANSIWQTSDNLQDELVSQARAVGVDASVFTSSGVLMSTTQPDIYSSQLMSRLIHPMAMRKIKREDFLFTFNDAVGRLSFRNTYAAIRSPIDGEVMAILSVPYFESQQAGEQNQLRLASNIWTVFALVFLLFYVLSFVALNWLTRPLQVIASSLKRTTLSGANRKLSWSSRDEIGTMVNEYNHMVDNLERSKTELAQKQREATWREMARQVAHEIKNPLTPIKLTLQQMAKAIHEGTAQPEKNVQSIKTVLHQVDVLNDIASSFSAFAQMPEIKLERVNLVDLAQETIALYRNTEKNTMVWSSSVPSVGVMADTKLFGRIFGNLILNAFQSGGENAVLLKISLNIEGNKAVLSFSDNGSGMSPEVIDKVFIPYFSTKETGSGLGLAIAKQGIEQAGGRIWCESKEGQGSTFYVALPLA